MVRKPTSPRKAANSNRRDFFKQASLLFVGAQSAATAPWLAEMSQAQLQGPGGRDTFPVVDTTYGKLRGINIGGIKTFRGVHYGQSTAGKNRFMPPVKPEKWTGVKDAIAYAEI